MKTNHYLGTLALDIQELPTIVAVGNNQKEQQRIMNELESLRNSRVMNVIRVDLQTFSFKKVIPFIEMSRMGMKKYSLNFINVLHPELEGEFEFQKSFYDITEKGSMEALNTLMNSDEEYVIQYARWIQHTMREKFVELQQANNKYAELVSMKADVVQEAETWKDPHKLKSSQMELSILIDDAFNPVSKVLDPHMSLNPSPSFQRNLVWTTEMKRSFIDSILKKLPIGAFYINSKLDDLTLGEGCGKLLWDGKQRLHAILSFYMDEFTVEYDGKELYYSQMRKVFNSAIRQTLVTVMTSEYETLEEIIEAYVMINAKQVKHTDEDLEKAKATLDKKQEEIYKL